MKYAVAYKEGEILAAFQYERWAQEWKEQHCHTCIVIPLPNSEQEPERSVANTPNSSTSADPKIASPTKTILSPEQILDKAFLSMQERHGGFKELEEFKNSLEYGVYVAAILEYHNQF